MDNSLVEMIAVAVAAAMAKLPQMQREPEMWNAEDIAFHMRVGKRQVLERYAPTPEFPKSTRVKLAGGGRGQPLWEPEEVRKWWNKYQSIN